MKLNTDTSNSLVWEESYMAPGAVASGVGRKYHSPALPVKRFDRQQQTHWIRAPAIYPNFTKNCACHEKWRSWLMSVTLGAPERKRRNARSGSHDPIAGPNAASKIDALGWCKNMYAFTGPRKTHPQVRQYVFQVFHMKRHLQCAEQQASPSNLTKYCACHGKRISSLILVTYETSFTMRGATSITPQPHQMLPLPRKMMRIIHCRDICNVIYNARSNRHRPPTSPNTAPATQKYTPKSKKNSPKTAEASIPTRGRFEHGPSMIRTWIRAWSEHELVISHPPVRRAYYFSLFGDAFCIENYNISRSGYLSKFHQILRLPRKLTLMVDVRDIWNVIYNARSNKHHPPTSPNTAPATEKESHLWSSSHMKRHLQCAEQQASPPNLTKCCPCHEKWCASFIVVTYATSFTMREATGIALQPHQILRLPRKSTLQNQRKIRRKQLKRQFQRGDDSNMIRAWSEHESEHDPNMNSSSRTRPFGELITFRSSETHFVLKITTFRAPAIYPNFTKYCACHENSRSWLMSVTYETSFTMRGATSITLQPHQILRLPRKKNLIFDPRHIWNVIYNARSNKHHPPTSPNAAPATKNDAHHSLSWHMQRHLQCAKQQASPSNLTKYCACLPRKSTLQNQRKICRKQLKRQFQCGDDSNMIRAWSEHESEHDPNMNSSSRTRPFGELTFRASETHFVLKITTFRAPAIYPNFTKYCACHEKWHSDITKYCACHEKWDCHWTVTELSCYEAVTELLLSCYWTELLLNCHWTVTELHWTDLLLSCYTELLLTWAVTELSCYSTVSGTQLLLDCYWTVTELTCYRTVTELTCYWAVTELLLLLHCYLNCCCTGLFAFLNLRNSEVSTKLPLTMTSTIARFFFIMRECSYIGNSLKLNCL